MLTPHFSLSQLAGRVLLIFLFIGFIIQGDWTLARVVVSILGFGACVMVAVGFKARWSASFLVLLLSVFNVSGFAAALWAGGRMSLDCQECEMDVGRVK